MPSFFNPQELTPEQRLRWDQAFQQYESIQKVNATGAFFSLSPDEKKFFKNEYNFQTDDEILMHINQFNYLMGGRAGDEKSALFSRLLSGRKPLIFPPPTSFSYPWYEVVEDVGPWEIVSFANNYKNLDDMIEDDNTINLQQCSWQLVEKISEKEAIITYKQWDQLGFRWKMYMKELSCAENKGFISSWHDKTLSRITTIDELLKEQIWHTKENFNKIKIVLDEDFAKKTENDISHQYGSTFTKGILQSLYDSGVALLQNRRRLGLSDYPSEDEILSEAQKGVQKYLDEGIRVGDDGMLYTNVWVLERITPTDIDINIYLKE